MVRLAGGETRRCAIIASALFLLFHFSRVLLAFSSARPDRNNLARECFSIEGGAGRGGTIRKSVVNERELGTLCAVNIKRD